MLKSWWDVSEAKARAEKTRAEKETAEAVREATVQRLADERTAVQDSERITQFGKIICAYAEQRRQETRNRNLIFSEQELALQLGEDAGQFEAVMEDLRRSGRAKRSVFSGRWLIEADHLSAIGL